MMKRSHSPSASEVESSPASPSSSSSSDRASRGPLKKKVKREMDEAQRRSPSVVADDVSSHNSAPTQASQEALVVSENNSTNRALSCSGSSVNSSSNNATSKIMVDGHESDASDEDHKLPAAAYYKVGGRIRLPDKLMEYLNKNVLPDTLWWQPDGDGFAFDTETIQSQFLDKHFRGTKLTSFIRSLNRWGFRRIFYHSLPKNALSFHHPLFKKENPQLIRDMKMISCTSEKKGSRSKNSSPSGSPLSSPQAAPKTQVPPPVATPVAAATATAADSVQNVLQSILSGAAAAPSSAALIQQALEAQQQQQRATTPSATDALQALFQLQQPAPTPAAASNPLLSSFQALARPQPAVNPLLSALGSLAPAPAPVDPVQAILLQALQQQAPQPSPAPAAPANSVQQLLQYCALRGQQQQQQIAQQQQQNSQAILQLLANASRTQAE